jgi:hypothetical protein
MGRRADPSIDREHIKRHEVRPLATEEQIVKLAAAIRTEADDLAVEHDLRKRLRLCC